MNLTLDDLKPATRPSTVSSDPQQLGALANSPSGKSPAGSRILTPSGWKASGKVVLTPVAPGDSRPSSMHGGRHSATQALSRKLWNERVTERWEKAAQIGTQVNSPRYRPPLGPIVDYSTISRMPPARHRGGPDMALGPPPGHEDLAWVSGVSPDMRPVSSRAGSSGGLKANAGSSMFGMTAAGRASGTDVVPFGGFPPFFLRPGT